MSSIIFKLRVLWWSLLDAYQTWSREVWAKDLDSHYCCGGWECGCGGSTVREMWGHISKVETNE